MARTLSALLVVAACLVFAPGCKCQSELGEGTETGGTVEAPATGDGQMRWCRACAKGQAFTACKRVDGQEPEETLKRKAELTACKDVGLGEAECAGPILTNVQCGVMP
ncbi:MAG: hypothetical protein JRG91_02420 [Deltaproteobacteria bacterium]|nr:hypothetical protein [Deltaproteobacteria bacterium]